MGMRMGMGVGVPPPFHQAMTPDMPLPQSTAWPCWLQELPGVKAAVKVKPRAGAREGGGLPAQAEEAGELRQLRGLLFLR